MGHLLFYLFVVAACLLWSAACIAAAARTEQPWLRWLLTVVAVVVPALGLAPWVVLTAELARMNFITNWFAPTLSALIAALVGGLWIAVAGFARRPSGGGRVAAAWPLVGLAALVVMAKAVSFGTLLFIDNAVAAEGRMLRVEAAQRMAALPPAPVPEVNAAPLSPQAVATNDTRTLDAAEPWQAAELLAVAASRESVAGNAAAALRDVVRIHQLGMEAAAEPTLVGGLVGQAINGLALDTLATVLPSLGPHDLALLDEPWFRDFLGSPPMDQLRSHVDEHPLRSTLDASLSLLYRTFLLPADRAGSHAALAWHAGAEAMVAATRARLTTGTTPDAVDGHEPERLPALPRE